MYTSTVTYENKPDTINFGVNTDHLGNVRAVVSDIRQPVDNDGDGKTDEYQADIKFYADYYPYGMLQPGRSFNAGDYRFGFQGQEKLDEITGVTGSHLDFGARIYDSRLGRFLSVDQFIKDYPSYAPYLYAGNSPIKFIDFNGNFQVSTEMLTDEQKTKVQRFVKVIDNIKKFADANPDIYKYISLNTGLSRKEIEADFTPGNGPTLLLGMAFTQVTDLSFENEEIEIRFEDAAILSELEGEGLDIETVSRALIIFHEYTHYGDRKTNEGWSTGEGQDIPEEKYKPGPGKQKIAESSMKERGEQTERLILGNGRISSPDKLIYGRGAKGESPERLKIDIQKSDIYKDVDILKQ